MDSCHSSVNVGQAAAHCPHRMPRCLQGHGVSCVADLGGSIITGIDGNPLTVLAKQLRIPLHEINSTDVMLYMAEGLQADQKLDDEVRGVAQRCWIAAQMWCCV